MTVPDLSQIKAPNYSGQDIIAYIHSYTRLTGKQPEFIPVSKQFLNWYETSIKQSAKEIGFFKAYGIGINEPLKDKEFVYDSFPLKEI